MYKNSNMRDNSQNERTSRNHAHHNNPVKIIVQTIATMFLLAWLAPQAAQAQGTDITADFTDPNFLTEVRTIVNKPTGPIYDDDVSGLIALSLQNKSIASLAGLQHFANLGLLDVSNNPNLTVLNVCGLTKLCTILANDCGLTSFLIDGATSSGLQSNQSFNIELVGNQLTSVDVSGQTKLMAINVSTNPLLTTLNVSGCTNLDLVQAMLCPLLTTLDLDGLSNLTKAICPQSGLTSLSVSGCTSLQTLSVWDNKIEKLDLRDCAALEYLWCKNNQLTELNVAGLSNLIELSAWQNQIEELDLSAATALRWLWVGDNKLAELDLSNNKNLEELQCYRNELSSLIVTGLTKLFHMDIAYNELTSLDVTGLNAINMFYARNNYFGSESDVTGLTGLTYYSWMQANSGNYVFYPQKTPIVPGAPTIGTATVGDKRSTVNFTAPASNGGSAITGYTVTSSPGGITATGASSPIIITGLTNGTAYTFTVTATNAKGTGEASAPSNSVTPTIGTSLPILDHISPNSGPAAGGTSVTLIGRNFIGTTNVTFGGATATGFTVNSDTEIVCTTPAGTAGTVSVYVTTLGGVSGLNNAFTYTATAPAITTTTLPNGTVGTAYSETLAATGTAPIEWSITADNLPAGLLLDAFTGEISGTPTAAGTFNFTVKAENSAGFATQALSITIADETTPPTAGGSGAITTASLTHNSLTLNWTAAADNVSAAAALKYYVYQSAGNNISTVADCATNGTLLNTGGTADIATYSVTGLSEGTVYYFNVVVEDEAGNKAAYVLTLTLSNQ